MRLTQHSESRLAVAGSIALCAIVGCAAAEAAITVGPFTFDDLAFADDATQVDSGSINLIGGATSLDDALTGYSPTKGLINIGLFPGQTANHFQLDFIDLVAENRAGADIVFFDARFSADPYQMAIRPQGGAFTAFRRYETTDYVATGVQGPLTSFLFGLPLDASDFGLADNTLLDAIQFRSLRNQFNNIEGDPMMAAVLNAYFEPAPPPPLPELAIPEPGTGTLAAIAAGWWLARRVRRSTQD